MSIALSKISAQIPNHCSLEIANFVDSCIAEIEEHADSRGLLDEFALVTVELVANPVALSHGSGGPGGPGALGGVFAVPDRPTHF